MSNNQFKIVKCRDGLEAIDARSKHSFPRHIHEEFGIGVIVCGAQKSLSGRGVVEARAGNTITVNPGEVHDGKPLDGESRAWKMLFFDPQIISDAANDISEGKQKIFEFHQPVISDSRIAQRFLSLFSASITDPDPDTDTDTDATKSLYQDELTLALFADLMGQPNHGKSEPQVPDAIELIQTCIDDDPVANLSLQDFAHLSGLSRFQVLRGFAKKTGLPPHAYIIQRRLHLSRRLIANNSSLTEAAMAGGFVDQSHMSRAFVKNFGMTPGAYASANK